MSYLLPGEILKLTADALSHEIKTKDDIQSCIVWWWHVLTSRRYKSTQASPINLNPCKNACRSILFSSRLSQITSIEDLDRDKVNSASHTRPVYYALQLFVFQPKNEKSIPSLNEKCERLQNTSLVTCQNGTMPKF